MASMLAPRHCGQFSASRADLRRVPLRTWKRVLMLIEAGHEEIGFYLELLYPGVAQSLQR